jgi:WD40 repeat protein
MILRYDSQSLLIADNSHNVLFAVRPDGTGLRRLPVGASVTPYDVAWSGDGSQIAFAAVHTNDGSDLFIMRADGTGLRQLTDRPWGVSSVSWSPDDRWIAFVGWNDNQYQAFEVRPDGSGLHRILTRFTVRSLAWGPGGRLAISAAFAPNFFWRGGLGIWTVNANGTGAKLLAGPIVVQAAVVPLPAVDGWSADGRSLLVTDAPGYGDVSLVPAAGGRAQVILHCPLQTCVIRQPDHPAMGSPAYYQENIDDAILPPGGKTIALIIGDGGDDDTGSLYEIPSGGGALRPFRIPGVPANVTGISWRAS